MTFIEVAQLDLSAMTKQQLKSYVKLARAVWGEAIDLRKASVIDLQEYLGNYQAWAGKIAALAEQMEESKAIETREVEEPATDFQDLPDFENGEPHITCLADFEGIDAPLGDWWMSCPLTCDPCNYQSCNLPESNLEPISESCPMTAAERKYFQAIALDIQKIFGVSARNSFEYLPAYQFPFSPSDSFPPRARITFDVVGQKISAILFVDIDYGGKERIEIKMIRTGKNDARLESLLDLQLRPDNLAMGRQIMDIYLADYQAKRTNVIQFARR